MDLLYQRPTWCYPKEDNNPHRWSSPFFETAFSWFSSCFRRTVSFYRYFHILWQFLEDLQGVFLLNLVGLSLTKYQGHARYYPEIFSHLLRIFCCPSLLKGLNKSPHLVFGYIFFVVAGSLIWTNPIHKTTYYKFCLGRQETWKWNFSFLLNLIVTEFSLREIEVSQVRCLNIGEHILGHNSFCEWN